MNIWSPIEKKRKQGKIIMVTKGDQKKLNVFKKYMFTKFDFRFEDMKNTERPKMLSKVL